MVKDLSKPSDKLTTQHDWLLAALTSLARSQKYPSNDKQAELEIAL
jgi:hypothetical protein